MISKLIRNFALLTLVLVAAAPQLEAQKTEKNASISTAELKDFEKQPEKIRKLIKSLLDLTKRNLTYKYGSADPDRGGMDCSGTMYFALRAAGFTGVPRVSNMQYKWIWERGRFHAVVSPSLKSFEFSRLEPGDLLFWTGTYKVDRDPPVTHAMLFLGYLEEDGRPVMVGASNGRTFEGKKRNGVSVFDFRLPRKGSRSKFIGYGSLPGIIRSP